MRRGFAFTYSIAAWLFLIGVIVQVFFAGLVVVARLTGWDTHIGFGHALGLPVLVMLPVMYLGRLPSDIKRLTWLLFAIYFIQADVIIFLRDSLPALSALHPVLALFDFVLAWILVSRIRTVLAEDQETAAGRA